MTDTDSIRELEAEVLRLRRVQEALQQALTVRSQQFHRAERERTGTFVGTHGGWMGRIYDKWEECPTHPCPADRKLLASLTAPSEAASSSHGKN